MANALDSDSRDWGFESLQADHLKEGTRNETLNFSRRYCRENSGERYSVPFDS